MMKAFSLFLSAALVASATWAAGTNGVTEQNWQVRRQAKIEALQQERLQMQVARESLSHQKRIEILQRADACIRAAQTSAQYRACEEEEKAARTRLREKLFVQHKTQMLERLRREEQTAARPEVKGRLQSKIACIERAMTPEALRACHRPKMGPAASSQRVNEGHC